MVTDIRDDLMSDWDESNYKKWTHYPVGKWYWDYELTKPPHPRNTCAYKSDDYPVLIVLNLRLVDHKLEWDEHANSGEHHNLYDLRGFDVAVWQRPNPSEPNSHITSASGTVTTLVEIDDMVERLKIAADGKCLHKNSKSLPTSFVSEHKFLCSDCGETWGYDSSG